MSWEGYYQHLCEKGHYWEKAAVYQDEDEECSICKSKVVWTNTVNTTNGSFERSKRVDGYVKLKKKSQRVCSECQSVLEVIYCIPKGRRRKVNE